MLRIHYEKLANCLRTNIRTIKYILKQKIKIKGSVSSNKLKKHVQNKNTTVVGAF